MGSKKISPFHCIQERLIYTYKDDVYFNSSWPGIFFIQILKGDAYAYIIYTDIRRWNSNTKNFFFSFPTGRTFATPSSRDFFFFFIKGEEEKKIVSSDIRAAIRPPAIFLSTALHTRC